MSSDYLKEDLVHRLQKFSSSLKFNQFLLPVSSGVQGYPTQLVSNTHRPLSSDIEHDVLKAFTILETFPDTADDCARSLDNLSVTLMDIGLADQASEISNLSVHVYTNTGTLDNDFAVALRNHSNHLRALGRVKEAMGPAQRAVEIYDGLPAVCDPGPAGAFDNLATCLYTLGQNEKALAASNKAVQISRGLIRRNPTTNSSWRI
ncbi:hypothetical protein C8R45DRAFT_1115835 [Mycena sanguinolenta]|nr:hypothetical protein C8R45DRAFT_1115835 [Mycena sanguinolenta]